MLTLLWRFCPIHIISIMNFETAEEFNTFVEQAIDNAGMTRIKTVNINDKPPWEYLGYLVPMPGNVVSITQVSMSEWKLLACPNLDEAIYEEADTLENLLHDLKLTLI